MATWREMSLENQAAASELLLLGYLRSSVSRSYYAGYCAVTSVLSGKVDFPHDGNNPAHTELANLVYHNLGKYDRDERRELRRLITNLWSARVDADYGPETFIDRNSTLLVLYKMNKLLTILGINNANG